MGEAALMIGAIALQATGAALEIGSAFAAKGAAREEARFREELGLSEAEDIRRRSRLLRGRQRAAFGKAGVSTTEGTPLEVLAATAAEAELEALRQQTFRKREADVATYEGQQAFLQGLFSGAQTLLGAVSTAAGAFSTPKTSEGSGGP